jgi:protein-L-isoaspartate(D-aspartate) O-methyltransferase
MHDQLLTILKAQGIANPAVLQAIAAVPRERFVMPEYAEHAYVNSPLPIGHEQTISQPYIVARMTELLLDQHNAARVLEIGTGSGYQAAILGQLVKQVYSVERIEVLYNTAATLLDELHYTNIKVAHADGNLGWPEHAPFDGIIVTAAAETIPPALLEQLAEGGRLLLPLTNESGYKQLCQITRRQGDFSMQWFDPVVFVPLLPGMCAS